MSFLSNRLAADENYKEAAGCSFIGYEISRLNLGKVFLRAHVYQAGHRCYHTKSFLLLIQRQGLV